MTAAADRPRLGRFDHAALIVDTDDTLAGLLVPVLRRHLAAGEPVLLVVGPHTERAIREQLGPEAGALEWAAQETFYQRLGFAFESFRRYLQDQHARGRTVHVIAEPDVRTDLDAPVDRVAAYLGYEAASNDAFVGYGCPVTCIWDSRRHPTLVIENVRSVHDHELTEAGRQENGSFASSGAYLAGRAEVPLPVPPDLVDLDLTVCTMGELAASRAEVDGWAGRHGFSSAAAGQVTIATNEIVTNGLRHGRPPVQLRGWRQDDTLVVEVDDRGRRSLPPEGGYLPPVDASGGMGLWIARQLADVLLSGRRDGRTVVRMYFPSDVTHRSMEDGPG